MILSILYSTVTYQLHPGGIIKVFLILILTLLLEMMLKRAVNRNQKCELWTKQRAERC